MTEATNPMLTTPVNRMLMRMSAPISLGMVSTFLFQIVDTIFVGQLGSTELAALAFTAPRAGINPLFDVKFSIIGGSDRPHKVQPFQ